jgi:5-methylcytosine-specific restriction protein A
VAAPPYFGKTTYKVTIMDVLEQLRPTQKLLVMNLLHDAGFDVSDWADYKGRYATSNPKSYNWSFEQPGEKIALCLWYPDFKKDGNTIYHRFKPAGRGARRTGPGTANWNKRGSDVRQRVQTAYEQRLPIRAIVIDGKQRNPNAAQPVASRVATRLLDPEPWAVTEFNYETGEWLLIRGVKPPVPAVSAPDAELSFFEGKQRPRFILHRRRESELRRKKIEQALAANGKLVCEVPNCGFDFKERYGSVGEGYAQVHHLIPLNKAPPEGRKIFLNDLAIVCANCHVMIHANGKCRALEALIA